jgi:recombination protein RecA
MKPETAKLIKKQFGDVFMDPRDIISKERVVIPTTPKLDIQLSGGIPTGSIVLISGKPKLGKSSLALQICANAQKESFGGRQCYYFDIEGRLETKNLTGIKGLDLDKISVIKSTPGNYLYGEKVLNIAEQIIKSEGDCIIVLDSSSTLCSESEFNGEVSANTRNQGPKLLASFTRKLANVIPVQNTIVIVIQHIIANTSGYGVSSYEDGGNKILYAANVKIKGKGFKKWEEADKQIGQIIDWSVEVSALGPPGGSTEGYLRFGEGMDDKWEVLEIACDLGLIEKGGAWYTMSFLDDPKKVQGQKNVWQYLNENEDDYNKLLSMVKELM